MCNVFDRAEAVNARTFVQNALEDDHAIAVIELIDGPPNPYHVIVRLRKGYDSPDRWIPSVVGGFRVLVRKWQA